MPERSAPSPVPAALTAFFRGLERRAALFAELQSGDAEQGDLVVATTMRGFHSDASGLPMAEWPRRFWQRLMSAPALRPTTASRWPDPLMHLSTLNAADRQALLSRLAAGLPEDEAAEILGVDLSRYRASLAAACPRHCDGQPDAAGWRALAEAIQMHARNLPEERMVRLARLREHALAPPATRPKPVTLRPPVPAPRTSRWRSRALAVTVLACVMALTAAYLWPESPLRSAMGDARPPADRPALAEDPAILTEPLDSPAAPAATMAPDEVLATHPDLELLRDPEALAIAQDAALLAWYQAGSPPPVPLDATAAADAMPLPEEEGRDTTF